MEYFAIINGTQAGPMSKEQLAQAGITPDTPVWRPGLPDWVKANTLPELNDIFMEDSAFGGYARVEEHLAAPKPEPYNPNSYRPEPIPHTNWLPWAVVATIVGISFPCIGAIFGIIGIVKADKANSLYSNGLKAQGDVANSSARIMTIIALVLGGTGLVLLFIGIANKLLEHIWMSAL